MADKTYQPAVYRKQGGSELVITTDGKITLEGSASIAAADSATAATAGDTLALTSGAGYTSGAGGPINLTAGIGGATGTGGHVTIKSGLGGAAGYAAGTIRLNSQNFTQTAGDIIGYQSKPAANATGTAAVYGTQISPRFAHGVAGADLVGVQSNPILKGTAAAGGNLSGDVRAFEARLESESGGTRTVTGGLFGIRFMNQLYSTITASGGVYPIKVDTHGNTLAWSGFAKLPNDGNVAKYSSGHYGSLGAIDGAIQVMVGATALWIPCYVSIAA